MANKDQIQGFLFENLNIKGQLIHLDESFLQALELHNYPVAVQHLIGQFMAAVALLSSAVKFPGTLSIQAQGSGDLPLIVAECSNQHSLRAVARWQGLCEGNLVELLGIGQLVITMASSNGQRYQGIVALEKSKLAQCLEVYFNQSEQIPTRIWLNTESGAGACGLLLQKMPGNDLDDINGDEAENWSRICQLTDTLTHEELQQLDNEQLLFRLYHDEAVRVFPSRALDFKCTCSRERTLTSLAALGETEIGMLFREKEIVQVKCEFCNTEYNLSHGDVLPYLQEQVAAQETQARDSSHTLH